MSLFASLVSGSCQTSLPLSSHQNLHYRIKSDCFHQDVDEGSTVTDFLPAERARGITIQSAAITFHWPPLSADISIRSTSDSARPRSLIPHTINLIDTPGHADFTFEVLRSLRILDGAVCILDGVAGVEAQTEKVWNQANDYQIPRIIYVNKLDRVGAAFGRTVQEIGSRLRGWPAVCQIPWWEYGNGQFVGIGDVVNLRGLRWEEGGDGKSVKMIGLEELGKTEAKLAEEIKKARIALVELLSEHDDVMVEKYLEHDEDHLAISGCDITESLRRCLLSGSGYIVPVFAGASFRNIGVQPLLDAVIDLLPDPSERPDPNVTMGTAGGRLDNIVTGKLMTGQAAIEKAGKPEKAVSTRSSLNPSLVQSVENCALAFKVVNDARRGVLVYVRVYAGVINRNALLFNTNLCLSERAPRLLKMYASEAVEISSIPAGQIGVIAGLKHARTGDTLISHSGANQKSGPPAPLNTLQLGPIEIPPPVFFSSVEPASLSDENQVEDSLALLLREDPSLQVAVDEDSGQTMLSGMGELHLEIARDRLVDDFRAKAEMGRIEIGYRETILDPAGPSYVLFDKEIAGKKGKAGCEASVAPFASHDGAVSNSPGETDAAVHSIARDGNLITVRLPALFAPERPTLPSNLTPSTIHTALAHGALAGLSRGPRHFYPVHSVAVTLTLDPTRDIHGTSTSAAALTSAARLATRAALALAASSSTGTALMEPVMSAHISVDEASLGAVVHDLSAARGGQVLSLSSAEPSPDEAAIPSHRIYAPPDPFGGSNGSSTSAQTSMQQRNIVARVPLKEMVGYLKHLRSLTGGRGTFVMSVDRFERISRQREKALLAEQRGI